jgi:hypothetical protein
MCSRSPLWPHTINEFSRYFNIYLLIYVLNLEASMDVEIAVQLNA